MENFSGLTATYSPEDNKLRLYSVARLDRATYERVKAAGFAWAPRQGLFVAPMWTPSRADLLAELCGEIGDEDTSLVDRAEERADRFGDYSDKRASDAQAARTAVSAITEHIPFGQPILVGHHSERRARKDAERIENGMRRAVQMWDTANYWKRRAAGALAHAKHKERADVRARRIKTIEADKRKQERILSEAEFFLKAWSREGLTMDQARAIAARSHYSQCFPLAEYPRNPPASQYEGQKSLWSALEDGVINVEQARAICLRNYPATIAHARRWIEHYENRITYERAMLEEQGGLAGEKFALEVGGQVLAGGEWLTIMRVNKKDGRAVSVTTNARFVRVRNVEEITDYKAPSAEVAEKVKAATKLPPLVNYPGEGFTHITQAQWDAIAKDYRGTRTVEATATHGRHRTRTALGCFLPDSEARSGSNRHSYHFIYITDAKTTQPPAVATEAPAKPEPETIPAPVPEPVEARPAYQPPQRTEFDDMREQLRAGVKVVSAPQLFPTPADLAARMVEMADPQDGARVLEPSAGTARIVNALRASGKRLHVVAVEINRALSDALRAAPATPGQEVEVMNGDFLELANLGAFDVIVMNPPFANADDIRHIEHALTMLKPGGRLVAICANGSRQRAKLLPLVEQRGGEWEELPPGTFAESGTGVCAVLLTITA